MAALNDGEMRIVACTAPFLGVEKCEESTIFPIKKQHLTLGCPPAQ